MTQIMRMPSMWSSSVAALVLFFAQGAAAAPLALDCPARYPDERHTLKLAPKKWDGFVTVEDGALLSGAGAYTVMQDVRYDLRGDDLHKGAGRKFGFDGSVGDGEKSVYCGYGVGGEIRLVHRLPVAIKHCKTRERRIRSRLQEARILCD